MLAPPVPILVMHDDAEIHAMLSMLLEEEVYPVSEAVDGATPLTFLRVTPSPQSVLCNDLVPLMNGEAVVRAMARSHELQRHVILLLTTYNERLSKATRARVEQLDVPVIAKPVEVDHLMDDAVSVVSGKLR